MGHSDVEKRGSSAADRRISVRVVYETVAMVADYDGQNFPLFSAFWEVQTTDLSATGIGFVSNRRPQSDRLLLLLGNPQAEPIFIEARVARCVPNAAGNAAANANQFRIGCELLRRLTR